MVLQHCAHNTGYAVAGAWVCILLWIACDITQAIVRYDIPPSMVNDRYGADTYHHHFKTSALATATSHTSLSSSQPSPRDGDIIIVPVQRLKAGVAGQLLIEIHLPAGYHLNPRAPLHYHVQVSGTGLNITPQDRQQHLTAPSLPLTIPLHTAPGSHNATLDVALTFYYCRTDDTGVCALASVHWQVVLHISPTGDTSTSKLSYETEAPEG